MNRKAYDAQKMARAEAASVPVSMKQSAEVCRFIRHRPLQEAIELLEEVSEGKRAVPYKRFNRGGVGHRPGQGTGRYPLKACREIIKVLKEVQANAQQKGLSASQLVITDILANKEAKQLHAGRHRRRLMKRTNLQVVVQESEAVKGEERKKKSEEGKSPQKKTAAKKEQSQAAAKETKQQPQRKETTTAKEGTTSQQSTTMKKETAAAKETMTEGKAE